ncbi:MAG: cytochrome c biogenesis protein CcdA [Spirochaeta sp.]|nr:cytochrome c biogenesis protein CcdA [Spirochaeta sp.]
MTANLHLSLAFLAGLLSFLSPCILPLIPSYLSFIGGISFLELQRSRTRRLSIFLQTLFFVLGFSVVFITLGVLFSSTGGILGNAVQLVNIIAGAVVILLGFNFIFDFWKILNREKRVHIDRKPPGFLGSILLGMAFGGGWTPCVGPILASILILAGSSGKMLSGIFLLIAYSAGLGLPFLLAGLFFSQFARQMEKIKPHLNRIRIASGIFLIMIGILILLGRLQRLNIFLFSSAYTLQAWQESSPLLSRLLLSTIFLIPFFLLLFSYIRKARKVYEQEKSSLKKLIMPGRIIFLTIFLLLGVLSLSGTVNLVELFSLWFTFQGI